jgi:uncharacterized protein (DUF1684 family)
VSRPTGPPGAIRRLAALGLCAGTLAGACNRRPPADPAYLADLEAWRAERLAKLTADNGWLTLVALVWLEPGDSSFGSAPTNHVVLPGRGVPPVAGTLTLATDGAVVLRTAAEAGVTIDGQPVTEVRLRSDRDGSPQVVAIGPVRFHVIERGGRKAVRARDSDNPARAAFAGIEHFPVDPRLRLEGRFEPYAQPREVRVPSHQGPDQTMLAAGLVRFEVDGRPLALEPLAASREPDGLFFVFRDATAGTETYGAGRFLDADLPDPATGAVILDFNRAYNPPCAFTPYATCPLPPPQNVLPVRIAAGEMMRGGGH